MTQRNQTKAVHLAHKCDIHIISLRGENIDKVLSTLSETYGIIITGYRRDVISLDQYAALSGIDANLIKETLK